MNVACLLATTPLQYSFILNVVKEALDFGIHRLERRILQADPVVYFGTHHQEYQADQIEAIDGGPIVEIRYVQIVHVERNDGENDPGTDSSIHDPGSSAIDNLVDRHDHANHRKGIEHGQRQQVAA
eukprot:CAMPEP_0172369756 /NCGR_PEP_ID=MMETSP1060-20121228/34319_1 /TAXON_ID=37318 /ORGANISM="Pseudo-nitzschia pungens, Strain cf. cingulata" /LENGTH=125 /DNA_ID=CAMNT_0013094795 /DNA_START=76 /DNA_END=449 /DNA_ORIENTATION=-